MIEKARRTTEHVREVWDKVCDVGDGALKTLSPWTEFQGKEDEYALFYAFQRVGALTLLARGPRRLHCFEARGPEGAEALHRLKSATRTGNTAAAIRKLGVNPAETVEHLFDLYHRGELKLARSPDKTLLYRTRPILDEEVQRISADIDAQVEAKLQGFQDFVALIEGGIDPSEALRARFGAG